MLDYFRAVAVDFDETLTSGGRPTDDVLHDIADTRAAGQPVVLVTGRILTELRADFPDVDNWFDVIVTENGAVISGTTGRRRLAAPVDPRIRHALQRRGHEVRAGLVLLACRAAAEVDALAAIRHLGLAYQLVHSRSELMILPGGVSKRTGLVQALADLGRSPHSTISKGEHFGVPAMDLAVHDQWYPGETEPTACAAWPATTSSPPPWWQEMAGAHDVEQAQKRGQLNLL